MPVPETRRAGADADADCPVTGTDRDSDAGPTATPPATPTPAPGPTGGCTRPSGVQPISFSKTKYPEHQTPRRTRDPQGLAAVLVLNRAGADARRDRLLRVLAEPLRQ